MNERADLYVATNSLNVNYQFNAEHEDASILVTSVDHHLLYSAYAGLLNKTKLEKGNIATAKLSLLYTDTDPEEGLGSEVERVSFDISARTNKRILSPRYFYTDPYDQDNVNPNKSARCHTFNDSLINRVKQFRPYADSYSIPAGGIYTVKKVRHNIQMPMFHETYHHSEQAIMHYLCSENGIKSLVNLACSNNAKYIYGLILDIYTERMLCVNCNIGLLGLQLSDSSGYLHELNKAFEKKRITPRAEGQTMLSTRVSTSRDSKSNRIESLEIKEKNNIVHEYDTDKRCCIFQANKANMTQPKNSYNDMNSLKAYKGAFFTSRVIKNKTLENELKISLQPF